MQYKSYNDDKIKVVKSNETKYDLPQAVARLYNEHQQTRDIVNKTYGMILQHVESESLWRLEAIAVQRMFSKNILEFRLEKIIYYDPKHSIIYIKTANGQLFRLDISIDDFLRVNESEFESENKFYCNMYDDLMNLANSVPKDLNGKIVEDAKKVELMCKQ